MFILLPWCFAVRPLHCHQIFSTYRLGLMHRNPSAEFKLLISDGKFGGKKSLLIKVVKLASLQEFNLISPSLAGTEWKLSRMWQWKEVCSSLCKHSSLKNYMFDFRHACMTRIQRLSCCEGKMMWIMAALTVYNGSISCVISFTYEKIKCRIISWRSAASVAGNVDTLWRFLLCLSERLGCVRCLCEHTASTEPFHYAQCALIAFSVHVAVFCIGLLLVHCHNQ